MKKKILYGLLGLGMLVLVGGLAGQAFAGLTGPTSGGTTGVATPAAWCKSASSTWTLCSATEVLGDATNPISNGNFTSLTAGVLKVSGSAISDIIPVANNSYDLGSAAKSWRNVYASGTLYLNGSAITGAGANTALSNLASVAINTSLLSDANNTDDLGSFGLAWKDIYASGTLQVGTAGGTTTSTFSNGAVFAVNGGNVGVGTASPGVYKLNVNGSLNLKDAGSVSFGANSRFSAGSSGYTTFISSGSGFKLFNNTQSSLLFSILNDGNFIFATSSVSGTPVTRQQALFDTASDIPAVVISAPDTSNALEIWDNAGAPGGSLRSWVNASGGMGASGTLLVGTTLGESATSTFLGSTTSTNVGVNNKINFGNGMCIGQWTGTSTPNLTIQLCSGF